MKPDDVYAIIASYREAARQHGDATESGKYKAGNRAIPIINGAYEQLKSIGRDAILELGPLMDDPHPGVRLWSASHLLPYMTVAAEARLKHLSLTEKMIGLSAKLTLEEWRSGNLHL